MAHVDITGHQHGLHWIGQIEQTQQIGCSAARTPYGLRRLLMRKAKLLDQP